MINWQLSKQCLRWPVSPDRIARLREVPHFSSGIVDRAKLERAWKSAHSRKGDTRRGERKMRDNRQSPSFRPFTADWFWRVKFVSPSKSIKLIQWDSFPHWAVIALVIGKLLGYLLQAKENGCFVWRTFECRQHTTFTHAKMLLVPMNCFLWQVDYALEENVLTEQIWFCRLFHTERSWHAY